MIPTIVNAKSLGSSAYRWDVETRDAETTSRSGDHDELVKNDVRLLLVTTLVNGLVADCIDSTVNHLSTIGFDDLLYRIALGEVDTFASDLSCGVQPLLDLVNYKHLTSTSQDCRVSSHQTNWSGSKDCYTVARLEARKLKTVPAGREDISKESKVGLVFGARR